MIILIEVFELEKFPKPVFEVRSADADEDFVPKIIEAMLYWYEVLCQNFDTYVCIVEVKGDIDKFRVSDIKYSITGSIPRGFRQLCIPGHFGEILSLSEIYDIKSDINALGDEADNAATRSELRLLRRIKSIENSITQTDSIVN